MECKSSDHGSRWVCSRKVLSNADLEKMVDTNDQWIRDRTGIAERRILDEGRATSDMAVEAVKDLLRKTEYQPTEY